MHAVWGPDPVRFEGRFYRIPEADIGPKPVHIGGPRLLVGAGSPVAVERAGRLGVGLTMVIFDWDTVRASVETFRAAADAAGHDSDTLPVMLQVNGNVTAEPLDERGPLIGSPEQVAADLDQAAQLGVEHVYWNTDDEPLRQLPLLAQLRRG
jgi:alkanesulfonate monooxygenase SsuD/methylene tetrahydromethanopterin reductase-like flavin-dependent oxidoreductase (luciferase family)